MQKEYDVIIVGAGFGGPLIRIFAGMYPDEVAGMVLVNPTKEETSNKPWDRTQRECVTTDEWDCHSATLTQAHESPIPANIPVFLFHSVWPRVVS